MSRPHTWQRGAMISVLGAAIGAISLAWFCYAMGLNFTDEGWSDQSRPWQENRLQLIGSCAGFIAAVLVFWLGFFQTTRSD